MTGARYYCWWEHSTELQKEGHLTRGRLTRDPRNRDTDGDQDDIVKHSDRHACVCALVRQFEKAVRRDRRGRRVLIADHDRARLEENKLPAAW